jgi:uncharacterized protein YcbK (DUF882 family)
MARWAWLAAAVLSFCAIFSTAPSAQAETRTLKLMFVHTNEKAEITFKRNGRYDQDGLRKMNQFLRDWRRNEPTKMDPRLFDLVWEAYRASGSNGYIHVVSAYRSPATNSMLRSRSKGVAKKSQHMLGKAMDFYIPGVSLKKLRDIGLKMQGGGVGYYPRSGSPFVHFDVGNVRHWPRMSRKELVAVFPQGKTLHVPSDGKPLPGFEQAVAAYEARRKGGGTALALASTDGGKRSGGLLAAIFGGGADEEEESGGAVAAEEPAPRAKPAPQPKDNGKIRVLPPELAQPAELPGVQEPLPLPDSQEPQRDVIVAALPTRDVPLPALAPRPSRDVGAPIVDLNDSRGPLVDLGNGQAAEQPAAEVALGIPIPTRRPDYTPAGAEAQPVVVASLAPSESLPTANAAAVPVPELRPAEAEKAFAAAALPKKTDAIPQLAAYATDEAFPQAPEEVIASPQDAGTTASTTASLRSALVEAGADPAAAVRTGVRTTSKAARPAARDGKPDRKPLVIAAQPHYARWALDSEYVANNTKGTKAPSYAYQIVTTAPREVYTAGFQQDDQSAVANRFSGKAVTFLSVARFN